MLVFITIKNLFNNKIDLVINSSYLSVFVCIMEILYRAG